MARYWLVPFRRGLDGRFVSRAWHTGRTLARPRRGALGPASDSGPHHLRRVMLGGPDAFTMDW
jgi:hypothetical protein